MLRPAFLHFLTTAITLAAGLPDPVVFDNIGAKDGLSQVTVRCMYQDRAGFLWFGTQDGLNRYDGYTFRVFRNVPGDDTSLPNNSIAAILEDRRGTLWIATTGGGIASLDRASGTFTRYPGLQDPAAQALLEDHDGSIWAGTQFGGLYRFDPRAQFFERIYPGPASKNITALAQDRAGIIWIATRDLGLERFHPGTKTFTSFRHNAKDPASLPHDRVISLRQDRAGLLWVGTAQGVASLLPTAPEIRFNKLSLHRSQAVSREADAPAEPEVYAIGQDASGGLWFGTSDGLDRLPHSPGQPPIHYQPDPTDERSLIGRRVFSILEDQSNTLWFGCDRGISRLGSANRRFATFRRGLSDPGIRALYEEPNGAAWIGTDRGLNRLDPDTGQFRSFFRIPGDPASLPRNNVSWIAPGFVPGHLWIGSSGGLCDFDTLRGQCVHQDPFPALVMERSADQRTLWIGSTDGLRRLDTATGTSVFYRHDPANPGSLADNEVRALAIDSSGGVWVGTRNHGLDRLDPSTGTFTHRVPGIAIYCLLADSKGRIWTGATTGLGVLDRGTGKFTRLTSADGLPNDTINAILEDPSGAIWFSTNLGLVRLQPETRQLRVYNISHGLQDNEFNGNAAHYAPASRRMYFGGINGFNRFLPEQVKDSAFRPPVVFTSFQSGGRELSQAIAQGAAELSWRDSSFSIEFAALDYSAPELNRYSIRLDTFDSDWHAPAAGRTAVYTNLDSGSYTFRVRATNSDGVWASQEAVMHITIVPPPWKRWWFLTGLAAILGAAGFYAYRWRMASFRAAQAAQERFARLLIDSQEAERKRLAADLHDGIGQSLIVIRNQALLALAKPENADLARAKLADISESASEAIEETRQLAANLRPQQLERLGLTKALNSMMSRTAASSPVEFHTEIANIDGLLGNEGEINLYRIVQEGVNNILKHSEAASASVLIRRAERGISLEIRDNGKGWNAGTPFPRGLGLTGITERARILGARHRIESSPGRGTVILVEIDL